MTNEPPKHATEMTAAEFAEAKSALLRSGQIAETKRQHASELERISARFPQKKEN